MNFYSSDAFCDALAASYFPNKTVQPLLYRVGHNAWRIPTINGRKPLTQFPLASKLVDFYEPYRFAKAHSQPSHFNQQVLERQASRSELNLPSSQVNPYVTARFLRNAGDIQGIQPSAFVEVTFSEEKGIQAPINTSSLKYLPRVSHGLITAAAWHSNPLFEARHEPAPTVLWNETNRWTTYRDARAGVFSEMSWRQRKLEQELGPLSFAFDDPNPKTLLECLALNSQQSQSHGEVDLFSRRETVRFFQEMIQRKIATVSSLRVGEKLLAASICATERQCLYYWAPAYAPDYQRYAPGILLLGFLLEESFKRGYEEFDFLTGHQSCKWQFATHTRLISDVGQPPSCQRPLKRLRQIAKALLHESDCPEWILNR